MALLDLELGTGTSNHRDDGAVRSAPEQRFVLGGVSFEFRPEKGVIWQLPALTRSLTLPLCASMPTQTPASMLTETRPPIFAEVVCTVGLDEALKPLRPSADGLSVWQLSAAGVRVSTAELALDVSRVAEGCYQAVARMGSDSCSQQLLLLLASVIVELAGGLCLHATAVEYAGAAVLLLGPSGAGKTTAAQLLGDVRCLAYDRVAVCPPHAAGSERWSVWALPGGSPPLLERSVHVTLPLAGFLRVLQSPLECSARPLRSIEAALYLREAIEVGVGSGFLEAQRLASVSALALAAPGGSARVVLGRNWDAELSGFLKASAASSASALESRAGRARWDGGQQA